MSERTDLQFRARPNPALQSLPLVAGWALEYRPGIPAQVRPMSDADHVRDSRIRLAAFGALRRLMDTNGGVITRDEMTAGFEFEGERIPFANARVGIWRPRVLKPYPGAALSITTAAIRPGVTPRYDDDIGSDNWFEYRYQGNDPYHWHNRSLRATMERQLPVIYFYGVSLGLYLPMFPAYVVEDHPERLTFAIAADTDTLSAQSLMAGGSAAALKEYATRVVKERLHQRKFRELVVSAYQRKCAVCSLGNSDRLMRLLDAAHILPDHDHRGMPEVPNGLSLCKIHHSAYDSNILGISPDQIIRIREDILEQIDGPMLQHGIKGMDGSRIAVPILKSLRPNRDYLAERFELFLAA